MVFALRSMPFQPAEAFSAASRSCAATHTPRGVEATSRDSRASYPRPQHADAYAMRRASPTRLISQTRGAKVFRRLVLVSIYASLADAAIRYGASAKTVPESQAPL
jgi:hypothetical protein